jgi:hypothetical protein
VLPERHSLEKKMVPEAGWEELANLSSINKTWQ